ncbi:hypothetical protein [Nitrosomonas sp. HPC101]|uniref:hypothetical protein n=1 Tax=Nitrosomonas sp. HPC101 TaxID=1658667 RepID=UPI00136A45EE|nr:hypothetical protein [Nitrosomonas sp. HPC101]
MVDPFKSLINNELDELDSSGVLLPDLLGGYLSAIAIEPVALHLDFMGNVALVFPNAAV